MTPSRSQKLHAQALSSTFSSASMKLVLSPFLRNLDPLLLPERPATGSCSFHYLLLNSCVLIPNPTGPGNSLDLIITMDHSFTNDAIKIMHLNPAEKLTVGRVFDCITNAKYDKYTFSTEGQRCRFCFYPAMALLRSAQCITDDSEVKASADALKLVWTISGDRAPADQQTNMIEGTF
jgi:hypothetical protein